MKFSLLALLLIVSSLGPALAMATGTQAVDKKEGETSKANGESTSEEESPEVEKDDTPLDPEAAQALQEEVRSEALSEQEPAVPALEDKATAEALGEDSRESPFEYLEATPNGSENKPSPAEAKPEDAQPKEAGTPLNSQQSPLPLSIRPTHYFETYVFYGRGEETGEIRFVSNSIAASNEIEAAWGGVGIGGRLAFSVAQGLAFGVDTNYARYSIEIDGSTEGINALGAGLYGSYYFEFPLKAYASYYLSHSLSSELTKISGTGIKLGLSYYSASPLSFNLEYLHLNQDEARFEELDIKGYESQFSGFFLTLAYRSDFAF